MKLKQFTLVLILVIGNIVVSQSQIDESIELKYWNLRNKFRKHFISYNPSTANFDAGKAIPIHQHNIYKQGSTGMLGCYNSNLAGHIKIGDAPEAIGMYLAALTLEYRMLKDEGKSTKSVLNEIYYLIEAINRLDLKAEGFMGGSNTLNGFLIRDDADDNLRQTFVSESAITNDKEDKIACITSDAYPATTQAKKEDAAFSKDHITDLFLGFSFVKKFMYDAPAFVQPLATDAPMDINLEVQNIVNRIMTELVKDRVISANSTTIGNFFTNNGILCTSNFDITMNYVIWNPIVNKLVPRGNNLNVFAYPVASIAHKLTNVAWDANPLHIKIDGSLCTNWPYTVFDKSYAIGSVNDKVPAIWKSAGSNIGSLMANNLSIPICDQFVNYLVPTVTNFCTNSLNDFSYNTSYDLNVVAYLLCSLASQSNTWTHGQVVALADHYDMWQFDLQHALLNNTYAMKPKSFYEQILLSAPCDGPYNYNAPTAGTYDSNWYTSNKWTHPSNPNFVTPDTNAEFQGDFPGYDYMFLYNMYRYYFKSQITPKYSEDNSCSCAGSNSILNFTNNGVLNGSTVVNRKFSTYKDLGIWLKEYISSNLTIPSGLSLANSSDIVVCNNAVVDVLNGGSLINNTTINPNDSIKIIFKKGTQLKLRSGSKLIVGNNTKIIIEKGASLILEPNTEIQLRGTNSLLDVRDVNTNIALTNSNDQILITCGAGNSQGGTAKFAGGNFSHGSNTKFIIENCYVQFGYDTKTPDRMNYYYASKADLQLQGDKSVLDLQGDLTIGNGANFTFTWPGNNKHGFIKFSRPGWWGGNTVPHILTGKLGGCSFELVGSGLNDKMMEVAQETVYMPDDIKFMCRIRNAKIEFTSNYARLQIPCDYDIYRDNFVCPNLSSLTNSPRGLILFGQNAKPIDQCVFSNFTYWGLDAELFYGGNKLFLSNDNFNNSSVYVQGKGADITSCNFYNTYAPLAFKLSTSNSNIKNCSFSTNQSNMKGYASKTGMTTPTNRSWDYLPFSGSNGHQMGSAGVFITSSPVIFNFENTSIKGFECGIVADQSILNVKCGEIKNNDFGIALYSNAKVNMSTSTYLTIGSLSVNSGQVDMEDNAITIFTELASEINLLNGFNNLKPNTSSHPWNTVTVPLGSGGPHNTITYTSYTDYPVIHGLLPEKSPCLNSPSTLYADYNYWKKDHSTSLGLYPVDSVCTVFYQDCYPLWIPNFSGNRVYFHDSYELYKNQFTGCQPTSPCVGNGCRTTPIANCTSCSNINTSALGVTISNNAAQAADNFVLSNNTTSNKQAASLYSDILRSNIRTQGSNEDKYVNDYAHHRLHQTFGEMYDHQQIPDSMANQVDLVNAIQALDAQITPLDTSNGNYTNTIFTLLEKGQLYRASRLRQVALNSFNQALTLAKTQKHKDYINQWICLTNAEITALSDITKKGEFSFVMDSCTGRIPANLSSAKTIFSQVNSATENRDSRELNTDNSYDVKIYPNPTSGIIYIAYHFDEPGDCELILSDVTGKEVKSIILENSNNLTKLDNKDLESGIYFYQVKKDDKLLKTDKLIIVK